MNNQLMQIKNQCETENYIYLIKPRARFSSVNKIDKIWQVKSNENSHSIIEMRRI